MGDWPVALAQASVEMRVKAASANTYHGGRELGLGGSRVGPREGRPASACWSSSLVHFSIWALQ